MEVQKWHFGIDSVINLDLHFLENLTLKEKVAQVGLVIQLSQYSNSKWRFTNASTITIQYTVQSNDGPLLSFTGTFHPEIS